jgi:hypothetical protein
MSKSAQLRILIGEDAADLAIQLTTGAAEGAGIARFHDHDAIAALVVRGVTTNDVQSWRYSTKLMVEQRIRAALEQPLPQARTVPAAIEGRIGHKGGLIFILSIGKQAACQTVTEAELWI